MRDHIHILELGARNELPSVIDRSSELSLQAAFELLNAGHLSGLPAQSANGPCIAQPSITLSGREFLDGKLKKSGFIGWLRRAYSFSKPTLAWVASIVGAVIAAYFIKQLVGE